MNDIRSNKSTSPIALGSYPLARPRRLREHAFIRDLVRENRLGPSDLIWPVFVCEGEQRKEPVDAMPGVARLSIDLLVDEAKAARDEGIRAIALFPVVPAHRKDPQGTEAWNPDGLIPRAVSALKSAVPEVGVICDIALDPYTSHGQDGLLDAKGYIRNDATVEVLVKQTLSAVRAGADIVAPSDMMDGRVRALRLALEQENFPNTRILAYSAKYASTFYSPFREAVGSATHLGGAGKETYQMDPGNGAEALLETELDVLEGADMVMVKPGLPYLDIVYRVKAKFGIPTFVYQVSGEYAMLKAASNQGWLDERKAVLESLMAFKRAGADAILTYYARDAIRWMQSAI